MDATDAGLMTGAGDRLGLHLLEIRFGELLNSTFKSSSSSFTVEITGCREDIMETTSNTSTIIDRRRDLRGVEVNRRVGCSLSSHIGTLCYGRAFFGLRGSLSSSRLSV